MRNPTACIFAITLIFALGCGPGSSIDRTIERIMGKPSGPSSSTAPAEDPYTLGYEIIEDLNVRDFAAARDKIDRLKTMRGRDDRWTQYAEAYLDYSVGQYDEALRILNALNPGPHDTSYLDLRAYTYFSMNRLDDGRADMETLLLADPADASHPLRALWNISLEKGEFDKARDYEGQLEARPQLSADDMLATFDRALLELDFDMASDALKRLPTLPSMLNNPGSEFYDPEILLYRAKLATAKGEIDRAVDILKSMPQELPNVTANWPVLAWLGVTVGRYDDARLWAIEGAIRVGGEKNLADLGIPIPESLRGVKPVGGPVRQDDLSSLLACIGFTSLADGNPSEAVACADEAFKVNRYNQSALLLKSSALKVEGDMPGAMKAAVDGMALAPYDSYIAMQYLSLAHTAPAAVESGFPDTEKVMSDELAKAKGYNELYPKHPPGLYVLGRLLELAGDQNAGDYFRQAYETWPYSVDYAFSYAAWLAGAGDTAQAIEIIHRTGPPRDLPWLVEFYRRAAETGSEDLLDFANWLRTQMDPQNEWSQYIDPLAQTAE